MTEAAGVRLLVCGNTDRGDDGAAIWAVARLLAGPGTSVPEDVEIRRCGQLDVEHLLEVPAQMGVIIVDAAVGVPAGTIVTLTLDQLLANPSGPAPQSSHALPIDQVVGIASVLADEPRRGLFVGIGGESFGFGQSMSPAVRAGMPAYVEAIAAAIALLAPPATVPGG
jgi:hydrogenase maturation protease